jgi:signal transduction histidine kinase/ActR/RegA family two-component response regulator
MVIRRRLFSVMAVMVASSLLLLLLFWLLLQKNVTDIMATRSEDTDRTINRIIQLEGRVMKGLAFDYTYWTEMVDYVKSGDEVWAAANLDTALESFSCGGCWVLRDDFSIVGFRSREGFGVGREYVSPGSAAGMFSQTNFPHWFGRVNGEVVEFHGAPIQPTEDITRVSAPQGYFVLARIWDLKHQNMLRDLLGAEKIVLADTASPDSIKSDEHKADGCSYHVFNLPGLDGKNLYLHVSICSPAVNRLVQINGFVSVAISLMLLVLMAFFVMGLTLWISLPISLMSQALEKRDASIVDSLAPQKNEIGRLAKLIKHFFQQQTMLEQEIALRKDVQAKQERQNSVLRMWGRCNFVIATCADQKAMLERISRIIMETGSYRTVWIGEVVWSGLKASLNIQARYGDDGGYLDSVKDDFLADPLGSSCVAGRAIRTKEVAICRSIEGVAQDCPKWEREAGRRGIKSAVCFPVCKQDEVFAVLTIMSNDPTGLDVEERRVIGEIAENIGAAILLRKAELARKNAEVKAEELSDQLMRTQKLQAVGRLAGGIAHDFNNLLFVIMGNLELVLSDERNKECRKELLEAMEACRQASTLTKQLLSLGRKKLSAAEPVDVNAEIEKAVELMKSALKENVAVRLYLDSRIGHVMGDPVQIRQVIMNLALNAGQAMAAGGEFKVVTENVFVESNFAPDAIPGNYVLITASDTGTGMDESVLGHIFEPFFTTREDGTGLGLALVNSILAQHGGFVRASSTKGAGSTFRVFLPVAEVVHHKDKIKAPPKVPKSGNGETVLLVEDRDMCRMLTRTMLESIGYRVLEASSGMDAMKVVSERSGSVDLILTDVVMPGMSGPDMVIKLREQGLGSKVVYMSGYADGVLAEHGLDDASMVLLSKPFMLSQLAQAVRDALAE